MNNWKAIWENKNKFNSDNLLYSLIKTNGFDSVYANYNLNEWNSICYNINMLLELRTTDKVLEVGCGSGALIYALSKYKDANFYGIDYSESLINIAHSSMPQYTWKKEESCSIGFDNNFFDVVIVHSVFQYMPSKEYLVKTAKEILRVSKPGAKIIIADIYDKEKIDNYLYLRSKMVNLTIDEYLIKNKSFEHMFLTKKDIDIIFKEASSIINIDSIYKNINHINTSYNFSVMVTK